MKIAYLITPHAAVDRTNGIKSQAVTWGEVLKAKGHDVVYINPWNYYEWESFDAIHFFGNGPWVNTVRTYLSKKNPKCVYSPIYDPNLFLESRSQFLQKKLSRMTHGKWHCSLNDVCLEYKGYRRILVRTENEKKMIKRLFDVPEDIVSIVPLSFSHDLVLGNSAIEKEPFVFHMSLFTQPRKNVKRLILAAKKYNFDLVIAGKPESEASLQAFKQLVGNANNIKMLGFISEEQKKKLYQKARVFALPSISEGVGIVAVDAAMYGADIVMTNVGGPKEYYGDMAAIVNPYDIDEIGKACVEFLEGKTYQPKLKEHIMHHFDLPIVADRLIEVYQSL